MGEAEQAVAELRGGAADPARRADLEEFLRLACDELAATIRSAQEDVAVLTRQTALVQTALAEQMRSTRNEHVIEPVRLPDLLAQSLEIVPDPAASASASTPTTRAQDRRGARGPYGAAAGPAEPDHQRRGRGARCRQGQGRAARQLPRSCATPSANSCTCNARTTASASPPKTSIACSRRASRPSPRAPTTASDCTGAPMPSARSAGGYGRRARARGTAHPCTCCCRVAVRATALAEAA